MVNNKIHVNVKHDNLSKIELSLDEITVKIDKRLLNKLNKQNKRRR